MAELSLWMTIAERKLVTWPDLTTLKAHLASRDTFDKILAIFRASSLPCEKVGSKKISHSLLTADCAI